MKDYVSSETKDVSSKPKNISSKIPNRGTHTEMDEQVDEVHEEIHCETP